MNFTFDGYSTDDFGLIALSDTDLHSAQPNITWHEPAYGTPVDTSRFVTGDMTYNLVEDEYAMFYIPDTVTIDGEQKTREDMWNWLKDNVHGNLVDMTCDARKTGDEYLHWDADCTVTDESSLPCRHEIIKIEWQRTPWLDLDDGTYFASMDADWELTDTFNADSAFELEETTENIPMKSIGWNYGMVETQPKQLDTANTIRVGFVCAFKKEGVESVFYECYTLSFKVTSASALLNMTVIKYYDSSKFDDDVYFNKVIDVTDLVYGGHETCTEQQAETIQDAISYFEDLLAFPCYSLSDNTYLITWIRDFYSSWDIQGSDYANYIPYGYSDFDYTGYYELTKSNGMFSLNDATTLTSHEWTTGYIYQADELQAIPQLFLDKAGTNSVIAWQAGLYGSYSDIVHTWNFTRNNKLQSQISLTLNYPCTLSHDGWSETVAKGTEAISNSCTDGSYIFSFPYLPDNYTAIDEDEYASATVLYTDEYSLPSGYSTKPSDWTDSATITDAYVDMFWVEDGVISVLGVDIAAFPTWSKGHLLAEPTSTEDDFVELTDWAGGYIDGLYIKEDTIKISATWERGDL